MPQHDKAPGSNSTGSDASVFFLSGLPRLEAIHFWISTPFFSVFTVTVLENCTLFYVIKTDLFLHKPMFYFFTVLAFINLVLFTATKTKPLSIFQCKSWEISFTACLAQMFFLDTFAMIKSSVLVAMAFDRYVAICNPLSNTSILTNVMIAKIKLMALAQAVCRIVPLSCYA